MSFLNKLMDSMRLSEDSDDDYFLDDDYEDDDKPAKKGLFKKDSYEDDYDEPEVQKPRFLPRATSNNKVVPMRRGMEVSLIKPTSLEDAREICDYLLAGKAVVLNIGGDPHGDSPEDYRLYLWSHLFHGRKSSEDIQLHIYRNPAVC